MDQRARRMPREYPGSPWETNDPNRWPNSETDPGIDLNHQQHLNNSQYRFVNIRDDSWVGVCFPLCTLCVMCVTSMYRKHICRATYVVYSFHRCVISYMCGTMAYSI